MSQPRSLAEDAIAHHQAGRLAEAEALYRAVLAQAPDHPDANHNLGLILRQRGDAAEALPLFIRAAQSEAAGARHWQSLGDAVRAAGGAEEAVFCHQRAAELDPDMVEAWNNQGNALIELGRLTEAVACYRRVIALRPGVAEAHNNLGNALLELGRLDEVADCYAQAIALNPDLIQAHSNLLTALPFLSSFDAAAILAAARRAGEALARAAKAAPAIVRRDDRDPDRVLRVGYLSPSLRAHVLAPYLEPVLRAHDRGRVSVHVYAHVPDPDAVTWRMRDAADSWTFIHDMSDDEAAARVADDGVDILIDPMGHWAGHRLGVFARKPAPIQVSYLCQGPTTGLAEMDYIIGDRWLNHDGAMARGAVETVVELPSGFQVTSFDEAPPIAPPPALANGFVTFGSFNNPAKASDATLDLWARTLLAVPGSRLLVKSKGLERPDNRRELLARLAARGLGSERVDMMGWVAAADHLPAHGLMDVMLDTTPFTGGRTSLEALWMGVPVVTLVGPSVQGRYAWSHLSRMGRADLAAFTEEAYVGLAAALASDFGRLERERRSLRPAILASSLLDARTHAAELEDAFGLMWRARLGRP